MSIGKVTVTVGGSVYESAGAVPMRVGPPLHERICSYCKRQWHGHCGDFCPGCGAGQCACRSCAWNRAVKAGGSPRDGNPGV